MRTDYFTRDQFYEVTADHRGERYTPQEVDRAQDEVVRTLETWAASSWATVQAPLAATGAMTAASAVLVASAVSFAAGDVGKPIVVEGAGADGGDLETTVQAFTSTTQVTLAAAAITAVTAAVVRLVPGTDGVAAGHRSRVERIDGGHRIHLLERVPVVSAFLFKVGDAAVAVTDYDLDLEAGTAEFAADTLAGIRNVRVGYRYGHGETPWVVRRAAIGAARALLDQGEGRGRIPEGVVRYTTETTTFDFGDPEGDGSPWPWAPGPTRTMRSLWGPRRPTSSGVRV